MSQLTEYIIALSNLYGIVHKDIVLEIYNDQNEDRVSMVDIEEYLGTPPEKLEKAYIYPHQDYFVHEAILEMDEFDMMLNEKGDKPHYVPNKKELLKYVDEYYFEIEKRKRLKKKQSNSEFLI